MSNKSKVPLNYEDFELYQSFRILLSRMQLQVDEFYIQYEHCHCRTCLSNLILASFQMQEINEIIKTFETILTPQLMEIFTSASIHFSQSESGFIYITPPQDPFLTNENNPAV